MTNHTIRGNKFTIDADGFVVSSLGELGHTDSCEEIAELLQSLFDIIDTIKQTE